MKRLTKSYALTVLVMATMFLASCSSKTTAEDKEVQQMDSVSAALEKSDKDLEKKTKELEASLEKIDKELNQSGNEK